MTTPTQTPPPRIATLVLITRDGDVLGTLPPFEVDTPWWQDAGPVLRATREQTGLEVTLLRLLETELPSAPGGRVTYLAEVDGESAVRAATLDLGSWQRSLQDHPRRRPYARPGGPGADLAWADSVLAANGLERIAQPIQDRTWNLSSLWRLPLRGGAAWLKVVPPFFEREGVLLEQLAGEAGPPLIAMDGGRMLLAEVPGEDQYDAALPELLEMVDILVDLQARWSNRTSMLLGLGLPDWRATALHQAIEDVVARSGSDLTSEERSILSEFLAELPSRFSSIEACGLPDTLVHGDFHPGNVRGRTGQLVLLDWGDSGVGHPLLDHPAFLSRIDPGGVASVRDHWHALWRRAKPGSDPDRASDLLAPVAAARQAVIYRRFLDQIEPSEHAYHRADVPDWLKRTATILRAE